MAKIDEKLKFLKREYRKACKENGILLEAINLYADPTFYFAVRLICDPPCGGMAYDLNKINKEQEAELGIEAYRGNGEYYYGKAARKALMKVVKIRSSL